MKLSWTLGIVLTCTAAGIGVGASPPANEAHEWIDVPYGITKAEYKRLFAIPPIKTVPDFTFSVLVPPGGKIYDPFDIHILSRGSFLVADDAKTGHIWKVDLKGRVTSLAAPARYAPYTFDIAPAEFGKYAGQIYALAFNEPIAAGGWELADAIIRIDPSTGHDTLVCYLPRNQVNETGGGGFFARFGPPNSAFAGKLWITTASNHSIYQVTANGACKPFVTIDLKKWGSPRGIAFTPDGKTMLLGTAEPDASNRAKTVRGGGRILRMSANGEIADQPFASGLHEPGQMAFAPAGFGKFGGQLFVSDAGDWNNDVGIAESPNKGPTETVYDDGRVFRVGADGKISLVASQLRNPVGVGFLGNSLVIADINGDFHIGYQKFPDGFVVMISPR